MRTRIALRRTRPAAAAVAIAVVALGLVACEPPQSPAVVETAQVETFRVVRQRADRDGGVELRFDRDLDPGSVGGRSVRVHGPQGRVRCRLEASGNTLRIRPLVGVRKKRTLVVRLEGSPSPRALRAADGTPLGGPAEIEISPRRRRLDLSGPRMRGSTPPDGASDASVAGPFTLTFNEVLDRGAVRGGRAVTLLADGERVSARLRLSGERDVLVVRPRRPLPAGAEIEIRIEPALLDAAGNPAPRGQVVRFATRGSSLHEVREDFVSSEMMDPAGTSCLWSEPPATGFLVWGSARRALGPHGLESGLDLGPRQRVRFQALFPAETPDASRLASGVRLLFRSGATPGGLRSALISAGAAELAAVEPTFGGNLDLARMLPFPIAAVDTPLDIEGLPDDLGVVEIPFVQPLPVGFGEAVLVDVELSLAPGVRLAAVPDRADLALVDGDAGRLLLPGAQLLISGGAPQARSLWYDSGVERPSWKRHAVVGAPTGLDVRARFEFQTAPRLGLDADLDRASAWSPLLEELPSYRMVRFRVTFEGFPFEPELPSIDGMILPFETR